MGNRKESHVTKQKFDEFVLAHGRDILWFCRMTAGNAHEGDELYQDTMLTLLEHLDRLDEKNNSKSYALSVAIRLWKIADENLHGGCGLHHRRATKYIYKTAGKHRKPGMQIRKYRYCRRKQYMKCRNWCSSFPKIPAGGVSVLFGGYETDRNCGVPASFRQYR